MKRLLLMLLVFGFQYCAGQKVGVVFSGGGAKGLAHIGVLKALEENNIPIDYIVGTSMGGVVGSMYAAGYSPKEIERIALTSNFQDWVTGKYDSDYRYFFQKKQENPSSFTLKLQIDTGFQAKFRSTLVNDIPLNFALIELYTQASMKARNNFDQLFVPFRCVVGDVFSQKAVDIDHGSLAEAIRGTITVPLIYRPVKVDGHYVFDGGLYDNFPVDIMKKDFNPDYIIGANVSAKTFIDYPKDDEKLMGRSLMYMLLSNSDSTKIGKSGIYIQPDLHNYSTTNFSPVAQMIKAGYDATIADMPRIKASVIRRTSSVELKQKRDAFHQTGPPIKFQHIIVTGANFQQARYIEHIFRKDDNKPIGLDVVKKGYYRLVANDNFETIYPQVIYHSESNTYDFGIDVKSSKNFKADIGGVLSSRPISTAYLGLQYDYVNRNSFTAALNLFSGRFYESAQGTIRSDFPTGLPFYIEGEFTYNYWNYFNDNKISVERTNPLYIAQSDRRMILKAGIPVANNGKLELQAGYVNTGDEYSPNNIYQSGDTLDVSRFNAFKASIAVEKNSLNRKQYANKGNNYYLGLQYYNGDEFYQNGSVLQHTPGYKPIGRFTINRNWLIAKISQDNYFYTKKQVSLGYLVEGVLSNKPLFRTYEESVLSSPTFYPSPDSRTLILSNFRAPSYGAGGLKCVVSVKKNLEWRTEGYVFVPLRGIRRDNLEDASYNDLLGVRRLAANTGLVYHTFLGPVGLSFNYYDDDQKRFGVLFHAGFLIFNKRALE